MTKNGSHPKRAWRYTVPNNEKVLLSVEQDKFAGSLVVLSMTGGTMRISRKMPKGTLADLKMQTVAGNVTAVIEMLDVRAGAQAFKFVQFDRENKKRYEQALKKLSDLGLGDERGALHNVIRFAKSLVPGKK